MSKHTKLTLDQLRVTSFVCNPSGQLVALWTQARIPRTLVELSVKSKG